MHFEYLPTEIVNSIFHSCTSISDIVNLSSTCRRFRHIYNSSQKLSFLEHAAEAEFGPLQDVVQLLSHNASQPAHLIRSVPLSFALLKQIVHTGRIAEKWCDIYPFKKWKHNFEDRRLLTADERCRLRRALYRLWLYTRAFHNPYHSREYRMNSLAVHERSELLHNWSTAELAEIADVHAVLREVVHSNICPSNGTIARKFQKRFPEHEHHQLLFNIHLNYPPTTFSPFYGTSHPLSAHYHTSYPSATSRFHYSKYTPSPTHEPGGEGWGDDILHYYVVEDMLKLDPEQILWLKENAPLKRQVEMYVKGLGDWFENNGETWSETLGWVLRERGEDVGEILGMVDDGGLGIAVEEDK